MLKADSYCQGNKSYTNVTKDDIDHYLKTKGIIGTKESDIRIEAIRNAEDTLMYLVNYENGWELLSADKRVSKVLVKGTGNVGYNDLRSNEANAFFMDELIRGMSAIKKDRSVKTPEEVMDTWQDFDEKEDELPALDPPLQFLRIEYNDTTSHIVKYRDHFLQTKWGQNHPWNMLMPFKSASDTSRCRAGCVPVAAGQILYYLQNYYNVPIGSYGSAYTQAHAYTVLNYTNVNFYNYSSNYWNQMATHQFDQSGNSFETVSALLLLLGYFYQADYYSNVTLATTLDTVDIFPLHFGISCQSINVFDVSLNNVSSILCEQLYENELPIMMNVMSGGDGHALVLDGYNYEYTDYTTHIDVYVVPNGTSILPGQSPLHSYTEQHTEESTFVAVNWGWDGMGDSTAHGQTVWYNINSEWVTYNGTFDIKKSLVYNFQVEQ